MSINVSLLRVAGNELEEYKKNSSLLEDKIFDEKIDDASNYLCIYKSWDGIIFLLMRQNLEGIDLSRAILSGNIVDENQDFGYGPAHFLSAEEVKNFNKIITLFKKEDLKTVFNPQEMTQMGIYPSMWDEGDDAFEYLWEYFEELKRFYHTASENNEALISILG